MTNEEKELRFKHPDTQQPYLGRSIACFSQPNEAGNAIALTYMGHNKIEHPLAAVSNPETTRFLGPACQISSITAVVSSVARYTFWGQYDSNDSWSLHCAELSDDTGFLPPHKILSSQYTITDIQATMPPNGKILVCWTEITPAIVRIRCVEWSPTTKQTYRDWIISDPAYDSYRPDSITSNNGEVWLAWDRYCKDQYEVVLITLEATTETSTTEVPGISKRFIFRGIAEDWNAAKINETPSGIVCIWRGTREVYEDMGIFDRWSYAKGAIINNDSYSLLQDPNHPDDTAIIADFREGLLAKVVTKGYVGLRRNPQIIRRGNHCHIAWEVRPEETKTSIKGQLVWRSIKVDGQLGDTELLHEGGYCYALPKTMDGDTESIPVACFIFTNESEHILQIFQQPISSGTPFITEYGQWRRWKNELAAMDTQGPDFPRYSMQKATGDEEPYHLFWADTHCHTIMSPDAEGEPDELIHYALRNSGLDILGLVDNDFYPHKTLTAADWKYKKALSRRYSRNDRFLCPPAYEYTYHDDSILPDFNHRCILHLKEGELHRRIDPESRDIESLMTLLSPKETLSYIHHCSYRIIDPEIDRSVEVVSSWRVCLEETDFTLKKLQEGYKLGFIGSSDTHRQVPGRGGALTGVYATALTPEAILDAYTNRRIFATQGSKIFMEFWINDTCIGGTCSLSGDEAVRITAKIQAPQELQSVDIIKNGDVLCHFPVEGKEYDFIYIDDDPNPTSGFYYVRATMQGDPSYNMEDRNVKKLQPFSNTGRYPHNLCRARGIFAWTSPIWVVRT